MRFPYRMTAADPDAGNVQRVVQSGARLPAEAGEPFRILLASDDVWHMAAVRAAGDGEAVYWCRYENAQGQTWRRATRLTAARSSTSAVFGCHGFTSAES